MKVLITGGAGFIGSNIADRLVEEGYQVVIIDNLSSGRKENINKEANFYRKDIRDKSIRDIFNDERPDIVIHNAAQISVRLSVEDPIEDADINVLGSLNVLDCCAKNNVSKVLFASSGGVVYGEQSYFPADEKHPLGPISPYGVAKMTVEKYLNYFHKEYGMDYVALRYGNIYGPRQDPNGEAGVVAIFSTRILKDESPVINGDGLQTRDYTFVRDVVDANVRAIRSDFIGEINIGTSIETSVVGLFNIFRDVSGKKELEEIHGPAKKGEQKRSVLDYSMAKKILNWEPGTKIDEGIAITYKWFGDRDGKL